jgi:hypothetical protein
VAVEGVDNVVVAEVGGGGFVRDVDGVSEAEIPDREGLEFGEPGVDGALSIVVELGHTKGEFAAAGAGGGDGDDWFLCLDVFLLAVAVVTDDEIEVLGVVRDLVVDEDPQSSVLEFLSEFLGSEFLLEAVDDDGGDVEVSLAQIIHVFEGLVIIGESEVASDLALVDVLCADAEDEFDLVAELPEHLDFGVHVKAGQDAGRVIIITQLAAELEIELVK